MNALWSYTASLRTAFTAVNEGESHAFSAYKIYRKQLIKTIQTLLEKLKKTINGKKPGLLFGDKCSQHYWCVGKKHAEVGIPSNTRAFVLLLQICTAELLPAICLAVCAALRLA